MELHWHTVWWVTMMKITFILNRIGVLEGAQKNKTDLLLSHEGQFLAFGDRALELYMQADDDSDASSDDSSDDSNDSTHQRDETKRPMLFQSFKMALYDEGKFENEVDIRDKITSVDGRSYDTEKVFVQALKYLK
eukprot:999435_1